MKVLHVIPSVSPVRGGPSQAVLEMVKSLRDEGVDAFIVTTDDDGERRLEVSTDGWVHYRGVPIRFFPRFSPNINSVREFAFSGALTTWLKKNIAQYDLVHVHAVFSYPSTAAMAIARKQKIPYIVRPLGQLCEWSLQQSALKKHLYLSLIERANIEGSQGLHLTSQQEKREAAKLQLKNCSAFVVPHGLSFSPFLVNARQRLRTLLKLPADETIILFLSRIHPKKGLEYLIPALGQLKDYPFTFVLAGSGDPDYEAEVRSLLKTANIDNRTLLPGFVTGETKNLMLQGSDLYALTSHSENFGVAVLEALAVGLTTVVTPGVALAEEIKHHQLGYVSELSVNAIRGVLKACLQSPEVAVAVGDRARKFVLENYTWQKNADSLIEIYTTLLRQQRPQVQFSESDHAAYSHLQ